MNKDLWLSKFSLGIALIFLSFVIAQVSKVTFFIYITDSAYRNGSIAFYIISWLVFLVGIWLVGREYYDSIEKYATLKFYSESIVEGTKKVAEKVLKKQ